MSYKRKKTKIVATLGPSIDSKEMLLEMVATGVNVFRINFSHADYSEVKKRIKYIREINEEHGYNAAVLADLQGPKLRVGVMKDDVVVAPGDEIVFATGTRFEGTKERVYMTYDRFPLDTNPGEQILLDDGKLIFEVVSTNQKDEVKAKVIQGGPLKSKKGVSYLYSVFIFCSIPFSHNAKLCDNVRLINVAFLHFFLQEIGTSTVSVKTVNI